MKWKEQSRNTIWSSKFIEKRDDIVTIDASVTRSDKTMSQKPSNGAKTPTVFRSRHRRKEKPFGKIEPWAVMCTRKSSFLLLLINILKRHRHESSESTFTSNVKITQLSGKFTRWPDRIVQFNISGQRTDGNNSECTSFPSQHPVGKRAVVVFGRERQKLDLALKKEWDMWITEVTSRKKVPTLNLKEHEVATQQSGQFYKKNSEKAKKKIKKAKLAF